MSITAIKPNHDLPPIPDQEQLRNSDTAVATERFLKLREKLGKTIEGRPLTEFESEQREKEKMTELEKKFNRLSSKKREELEKGFAKYAGLSEQTYNELYERDVNLAYQVYMNDRFGEGYESKEGMKKTLSDYLEDALNLSPEAGVMLLSRAARISIDINGLKAINDLAGHDKGDEFLKRMALKMKTIKPRLESEFGLHVELPSVEGGDEFGFFIISNETITPELTLAIQSMVNEVFVEDCNDLLGLDTLEGRKKVSEKLGIDIPEGYIFKSSAATGVVALNRALLGDESLENIDKDLARKKSNRNGVEPTIEDIKQSIMGEVLDSADRATIKNKEFVKSLHDQTTKEISARTPDLLKLEKEKKVIEKELTSCKNARKVIDAAIQNKR